jgi:hypothetical protein
MMQCNAESVGFLAPIVCGAVVKNLVMEEGNIP